jgi:hypothetical protein
VCYIKRDLYNPPHNSSHQTIKKRCWMVSSRLQKQHFKLPFNYRRAKLSLVRTTPLCKYQAKNLTFKGNFNFHITILRGAVNRAMTELNKDQTVNWPFCFRDQIKWSLWSLNWTFTSLETKWCQACKLLPTKDLLWIQSKHRCYHCTLLLNYVI